MNIPWYFYTFIFLILKSIIIGSDFSFYWWIKDGKKYTNWYFNRPDYDSVQQQLSDSESKDSTSKSDKSDF